jgi:hypothetical protein
VRNSHPDVPRLTGDRVAREPRSFVALRGNPTLDSLQVKPTSFGGNRFEMQRDRSSLKTPSLAQEPRNGTMCPT